MNEFPRILKEFKGGYPPKSGPWPVVGIEKARAVPRALSTGLDLSGIANIMDS